MSIATGLKRVTRAAFNNFGVDLVRPKNNPNQTLLGLRVRPIQTVIDIGANTGQFAKRISQFFPHSAIHCFEPLASAFEDLSTWATTQSGRVIPHNLAIGDLDGEAEMLFHEDHSPSSSMLESTTLTKQYYPFTERQKRVSVRQATLDQALAELSDLRREILIKLDVQGYEARVIAGGTKTFAMASACILEVSLDHLYKGQANFKDLIVALDALEYRYAGNLEQTYGEDGHCIFLDAVFLHKQNCA